jgi:peroxiredoxin
MNVEELPEDLPEPKDDGACDHLLGATIPPLSLRSTAGGEVDLSQLGRQRLVLYIYPHTGRPGVAMPEGWDEIPGARGCTPQSCAFRDHEAALRALGATVVGLSSDSTDWQLEAVERLHLPFPLLSDPALIFAAELVLPTFQVDGQRLYRRVTLVIEDGQIGKVFYPVFPPDRNAEEVVAWLRSHAPTA